MTSSPMPHVVYTLSNGVATPHKRGTWAECYAWINDQPEPLSFYLRPDVPPVDVLDIQL